MSDQKVEELLKREHEHLLPYLLTQPGYSASGVGLDSTGRTCIKVTGHQMPNHTKQEILDHLTALNLPAAVDESQEEIRLH